MKIRAMAMLAIGLPLAAVASPDAAEGRRLVDSNKCESCHQAKIGGTAGAIYLRKDRKVTSSAQLKSQVAMCNTMLKIGLFPEDEAHIAAYLNDAYYKFPTK